MTDFLVRRFGPVALMIIVLAGCGGQASSDSGQASTRSTPASPRASTPAPTPAPTPTPARDAKGIPDDFPLAHGLAANDETTVTKPQRNVKGISLQRRCWGSSTWPGAAVDRLVVRQVGPELGVTRELAVYPDPGTAAAVAEQVRLRAARCHRLPATSDDDAMHVTLERDADTGGGLHGVSFSETLAGGRPGGSVLVFTRVGRAILAIEDGGEWTRASAVAGARHLQRSDRALVARLCVFRHGGC